MIYLNDETFNTLFFLLPNLFIGPPTLYFLVNVLNQQDPTIVNR